MWRPIHLLFPCQFHCVTWGLVIKDVKSAYHFMLVNPKRSYHEEIATNLVFNISDYQLCPPWTNAEKKIRAALQKQWVNVLAFEARTARTALSQGYSLAVGQIFNHFVTELQPVVVNTPETKSAQHNFHSLNANIMCVVPFTFVMAQPLKFISNTITWRSHNSSPVTAL